LFHSKTHTDVLRGLGHSVGPNYSTVRFTNRNRISIKDASGETIIEAGNTLIASGSISAVPGFIPQHNRIMESRAFLDMTQLPSSLIVLGGGVIGCEFACMAAQLGVKVTIVEMLPTLLPREDEEVGVELAKQFTKAGIVVKTGARVEGIEVAEEQADKVGPADKVRQVRVKISGAAGVPTTFLPWPA
jgi:dihydrolipoamide dehydrogenase